MLVPVSQKGTAKFFKISSLFVEPLKTSSKTEGHFGYFCSFFFKCSYVPIKKLKLTGTQVFVRTDVVVSKN